MKGLKENRVVGLEEANPLVSPLRRLLFGFAGETPPRWGRDPEQEERTAASRWQPGQTRPACSVLFSPGGQSFQQPPTDRMQQQSVKDGVGCFKS